MTDIGFTTEQQADHDYRRWFHSFEHHLGQLPDVLSMLVTLAQPTIGVSRGGSQFDRLQVSKGGLVNEEQDMSALLVRTRGEWGTSGPGGDAEYLWGLLGRYAQTVWDSDEDVRHDSPSFSRDDLNAPTPAKDAALQIVGWLVKHATVIYALGMDEDRDELFGAIRRLKAVHGIHPDPRPEFCEECGRWTLIVDYVDLTDGTDAKVGQCRNRQCRAVYPPGKLD